MKRSEMKKKKLYRYRKVLKYFEIESLRQPANDNHIQQPSLPFACSNDNNKDAGKEKNKS